MSANSPLNAALTSLLVSEAEYVEKLAEVRGVIAGLRKMLGVSEPSSPPAPAARAASKPGIRNDPAGIIKDPDPERSDSKGALARASICAALKSGPVSTLELSQTLGVNKAFVGYHLRLLKTDGVVVFVGVGRATKIALAGTPAKEAP